MSNNTDSDRAMSYVRKISLVAGSISALALMSTVQAARAADIMETQPIGSDEITVDWDLDAFDASDETLVASETSGSETTGSATSTSTTGSATTSTTGSMTTSTTGSMTTSTTGSMTTSTTGSMTTSTGQTSGALPDRDDPVVATETFTFEVANTTSNWVALSAATNW